MKLKSKKIEGRKVYYRPNSSDEAVLIEVIEKKSYRRVKRIDFDVEPGEVWLDLGANIGAFSLYCLIKGAKTTVAYEPDLDCFKILEKNLPDCKLHRSLVTCYKDKQFEMFVIDNGKMFSRNTIYDRYNTSYKNTCPNTFISNIKRKFHGCKMDIEGSEIPILLDNRIPNCEKLCLEYHLSIDQSWKKLDKCIKVLKKNFDEVIVPNDLLSIVADKEDRRSFYDKNIFCRGRK
jgi:FkbM family methyltransferase